MLGKTNLLFSTADAQRDICLKQQVILTQVGTTTEKIEYLNSVFFLFMSDKRVLYGNDMNTLSILKHGGVDLLASHVIYKDNNYYFSNADKRSEASATKLVVYQSGDLNIFTELTIKTEATAKICIAGLFLSTDNRIVLFLGESDNRYGNKGYLLVVNSLIGYKETDASFKELTLFNGLHMSGVRRTKMIKDRIFIQLYSGSGGNYTDEFFTLDGNRVAVNNKYTNFVGEYFLRYVAQGIQYSINAINYITLATPGANPNRIMQFGDLWVMFYTTPTDSIHKMAIARTMKGLASAIENATASINLDYEICSTICVGNDNYFGSTGGIVIKAEIDYAPESIPEVSLIKTLSARQALDEAKKYSDEQLANSLQGLTFQVIEGVLTAKIGDTTFNITTT